VPLTGATVPDRLKGIQLTIDVAGQKIVKRWCDPKYPTTGETTCAGLPGIAPNLSYDLTSWSGEDAYGRPLQGGQKATIQVIYVYEFNYYASDDDFSSSFAAFPSDTEVFDGRYACGNVSGSMETHFFCGIPVGQTITRTVGGWDSRQAEGLGGWTISDHHTYDPGNGSVYKGDGTRHRAEALGPSTRTVAGGFGGPRLGSPQAEGQDANEVNLDYQSTFTRGQDGSTFVSVWFNEHGIFKVGLDGKIRR
jgi:hypothetical protein